MPSTDPTWSTNSLWATRDLPLLILNSQFFVNGKSSLSTLTCPRDKTNRIIHYIPHSGKCFCLICEALKPFSATSQGVWSWVSHSPSQSLVSASLKCFWRNRVGSGWLLLQIQYQSDNCPAEKAHWGALEQMWHFPSEIIRQALQTIKALYVSVLSPLVSKLANVSLRYLT